VLQ
jgi:hypothetical protein